MSREIKSFKYLGNLNELNIRNDIRTRKAKKKKKVKWGANVPDRDYQWGTLIENYKDERLKVIQLEPVP